MKVQKLALTDFRGFRRLELTLEPDVTVLVGVNGAGKSSVLDALSKLLAQVTRRLTGGAILGGVGPDDVRVGASTAVIEATAQIDGTAATWRVAGTLPGHIPTALGDLAELEAPVLAIQESIMAGAPRLPLAIHLATNRSVLDIPERIRKAHEFDALSAYENALDIGTSDFRGFFEWFRDEEDLYNERKARGAPLFEDRAPGVRRPPNLDIVRGAIEGVFPGASRLRVERRPQRMMLEMNGIALDVAQLSDGEKCLLAMTGDIARRMVLADGGSPSPLEQEAIVLIDELELHLHPGLQRTILPRLRAVFPNTQFIVSTHSPQVLSSVHAKNVRALDRFQLHALESETWRRDTNRILESAFGDPGRPEVIATKLNALGKAVDEDRVEDARGLIQELRGLLGGEDDPDVVFYEHLLPPPVDGAAE
jgi:predicted ATP-binding protein involved in virulence